jgi:hypothetical protein
MSSETGVKEGCEAREGFGAAKDRARRSRRLAYASPAAHPISLPHTVPGIWDAVSTRIHTGRRGIIGPRSGRKRRRLSATASKYERFAPLISEAGVVLGQNKSDFQLLFGHSPRQNGFSPRIRNAIVSYSSRKSDTTENKRCKRLLFYGFVSREAANAWLRAIHGVGSRATGSFFAF